MESLDAYRLNGELKLGTSARMWYLYGAQDITLINVERTHDPVYCPHLQRP